MRFFGPLAGIQDIPMPVRNRFMKTAIPILA